ncbi:hypothetical protein Tco_0117960 [Tanacetum coccineum]
MLCEITNVTHTRRSTYTGKLIIQLFSAYVTDHIGNDGPNAEDADSRGFLADSDSMEDDTDTDSIDYPDEPEDAEDDDWDPEEDPSEEHKSEDEENLRGYEPVEDLMRLNPFEEDETCMLLTYHHWTRGARIIDDNPLGEFIAHMERDLYLCFPTWSVYAREQRSYCCGLPEHIRCQYDFVSLLSGKRNGFWLVVIGHVPRTIIEAVTEQEGPATKRTAYETELQEVRQAYLRFEASDQADVGGMT